MTNKIKRPVSPQATARNTVPRGFMQPNVAGRLQYERGDSIASLVKKLDNATTSDLIAAESYGVPSRLLKDMANAMGIPAKVFFQMMGGTSPVAANEVASNALISGTGGWAVLNMARLLGIAHNMVANSTASEAVGFDAAQCFTGFADIFASECRAQLTGGKEIGINVGVAFNAGCRCSHSK